LDAARYDAVRKLFATMSKEVNGLKKLAIAVTKGHLLAIPEGIVEVLCRSGPWRTNGIPESSIELRSTLPEKNGR